MPLNEILERRRRQNIAEYQRTLCCHICGSAARNAKGFSHFMDAENNNNEDEGPPKIAEMRMCACFQRPNDQNHDSVPLRVCEMCIADDALTGRIRCCGLCGIVACDENCVDLVECTDNEEWNNQGCLECRGFESFNEIEIFRRRRHAECARVNRICTKCLNLFTLVSLSGFSNYQFKCRYFKCNRLLVQSDIVELKRFLKPFPVSMLPEEMLVDIIDFLGAKDLVSTALTCTTLFKKIEKKSKDLVESVQHLLPNGPILTEDCESGITSTNSTMVYASGRNSHPLRPPEDGKTWLKILEKVEKMTKDTYFGFQVKAGDEGCAMRYLRSKDRIAFGQTYTTTAAGITPHLPSNDLSITGGQVIVKRFRLPEFMLHHREERHAAREGRVSRAIIFSADKMLDAGIHRVIFRYYCHCERQSIGKVGILSKSESSAEWVGSVDVEMSSSMGVINEEVLIGLEYNSNDNKLRVFTVDTEEKTTRESAEFDIPEEADNMSFAASLSIGSALFGGNQVSIRSCDPGEWDLFMSHNHDNNLAHRCRGRSRHGRADWRMRRRMRARLEVDELQEMSDDDSILGGLEEQERMDMALDRVID